MRRAEALWAALPAAVRYPLLASGSGSARLLRIAESLAGAINAAAFDPPLEPVLCDLAAHAWETDLFNPKSASLALQLHGQLPFFRPESAAFCRSCAVQSTNFLDTGKSVAAMLERGDTEGAKRVLSAMDAKEPGNPFWLRFAMHLGLLGNELDWYEPWLARPFLPPGFASWFRADYCFARGAWDAALPLYRKAFAATGLTETLARAGECASRLGRREEAAAFWKEAVSRRPWQINLLLRLADCAARTDGPGELPPGKGAIFLYSWNNAAELDATLASLAASDRDGAGVVVLDNGSADATAAVIAAWAGRFGECFRSIALPVNVGAPAARNWLLGDRAAQEADWVVFLDDDARLPRDWLRFFGTSVAAFPRAGVHGCRVVDAASPLRVQSVDLHFEPQVLAGGGACPNDALFLRGGAYRPLRFRPVRVSAPGRFRDRLLPSADAQEP